MEKISIFCECGEKSVCSGYCKDHFVGYVETTVLNTIEKFGLIKAGEKVAVAVSGGKDSLTALYIVNMHFGAEGIAIDEGIKGYRDKSLEWLKKFCEKYEIKLNIYSYGDVIGKSLDEIIPKVDVLPCTVCGVLRRKLLNDAAKGFDKIVTGHNLDDEAQSILINLLKGQPELIERLGPKTGVGKIEGFTQRIKPLYFLKEKEIATYAFLMGFIDDYDECPYARFSFRARVRDVLNDVGDVKRNIVDSFMDLLTKKEKKINVNLCDECGEPSSNDVCRSCEFMSKITKR